MESWHTKLPDGNKANIAKAIIERLKGQDYNSTSGECLLDTFIDGRYLWNEKEEIISGYKPEPSYSRLIPWGVVLEKGVPKPNEVEETQEDVIQRLTEENKALNNSCDNHEKAYMELNEQYESREKELAKIKAEKSDCLKNIYTLTSTIDDHEKLYIEVIEDTRRQAREIEMYEKRLSDVVGVARGE